MLLTSLLIILSAGSLFAFDDFQDLTMKPKIKEGYKSAEIESFNFDIELANIDLALASKAAPEKDENAAAVKEEKPQEKNLESQ